MMLQNPTYKLFIIHSWKHSNDYNDLLDLLNTKQTFFYTNYSTTPKQNIVPDNIMLDDEELCKRLKERIAQAQVIIVIAGMYTLYSPWIAYEIETAKKLNKPIIAIRPGKNIRTPRQITTQANAVISWNGESLIESIESLLSKAH